MLFQFSFSVEGAGTKKVKKEKLADGKPLIFPVDEFDLAEELKPAIAKFRAERRENAIEEAKGLLEKFESSPARAEYILMAREVLDSKKLSEDFYEHLDGEMTMVKQILALWVAYSQGVCEVKLWNQALRAEIRDTDSRVEKYDAFTFLSMPPKGDEPGPIQISIKPSIFQKERGMGFIDFNRSIGLDPAMRLDIPIVGRPGTPLEDQKKDAEMLIQNLGMLLKDYDDKVFQIDLRLYLAESVLRHEVKSRWFGNSMPIEIPNSLARYGLAQFLLKAADESQHGMICEAMGLISPATPDLVQLSRDLEALKWNELPADSASAEVRRAYFYFLMGAMIEGESKEQWEVFRRLPEKTMEKPAEFFAFVKEIYPEFEAGFSATRDRQLEELKLQIAKADKTQKKLEPEVVPDSPSPANYETSTFDGFTIQHPDFLNEAVDEIGPGWGEKLNESRTKYLEAVANRPWLEVQKVTDAELDDFKTLGLARPPRDVADQWAEVMAISAEADRLFSGIFTDNVHIWIKEDLQKILRDGGKLEGFSLNEKENFVTFTANFGYLLNDLSYEDMQKAGAIEAMGTVMLPVMLKQEEVEKKSKDELISLLEADEVVGAIQNDKFSSEELGELLGLQLLARSEEFCFAILIHELAEAEITEHLIASADRRWFTDGMATYIACEMTAARFGDDAGWKLIEEMYEIDHEKGTDLLEAVKLFEWQAGEVENQLGESGPDGLSNARYLYSAKAIRKAVQGQGDDFLKRWHKEIGKVRWNRATSQTVIDAYDRLTGGDLRKIVESIATDDL